MNTLNGRPVKLKGPKPVLTIVFGDKAAGSYRFILFDTQNKNPVVFGKGLALDQAPDAWPVPVKAPPQAVQVDFATMTQATEQVPVSLILSEQGGPPYWNHTYIISRSEFNRGLSDFFYLVD
jgi:hypothetical protein